MRWLWLFPGVFRIVRVETHIIMSKNYEKTYYAVGRGRVTGIFDSWTDCKAQVDGVQNAKYRKFYSIEEANDFVNFWKCYTSPVRENTEQNNVGLEEDEDKKLEDTKTLNGSQSPNLLESSKSVGLIKHEPTEESTFQFTTSPSKSLGGSSCHSLSISDSVVVKSMDLLALNLRLDSLEKRFDTCLKEIGGILSQVANIRTEVIGIREILTVDSSLCSSSSRHSKGGMVQSVLNFSPNSRMAHNRSEYPADSKSSSVAESRKTVISSRLQNSSKNEDNDSEDVSDRRALKRKLSKSREEVSSDSDDCDEHPAVKSRRVAVSLSSFTVDKDNYVEVYTDGACHFNGNTGKKVKAGIGVWFGDNHPFNVGEPVEGRATSNTAEIQAARVAVDLAIFAGISKLKIYTDSEFLINCITKWIYKWQKNGWKLVQGGRVKNKKELEKLYKVASKIDVRWEKVAGHTGIKGNEMADRLANAGAEKYVTKS